MLILGAGLAGMVAALELRKAGYKVKVLEYNNRAGGRNWTLRGGDSYTELGGATQKCEFDAGLYLNPGPVAHSLSPPRPARLLQAAGRDARAVHAGQPQRLPAFAKAFGGKPQRFRDDQGRLPGPCRRAARQGDDRRARSTTRSPTRTSECCSRRCAGWGALDKDYAYEAGPISASASRLCDAIRAAASAREPVAGEPIGLGDMLQSRLWRGLADFAALRLPDHDVPAGRRHGQDRRGLRARGRRSDHATTPRSRAIEQDEKRRHRRPTRTRRRPARRTQAQRRLVRLHHPAQRS